MSQSMIRKDGKERMDTLGRVVQANPNTTGSRPESWAPPRTKDAEGWMMNQARLAAGKPEDTLTGQALHSNKNNGKLNPRWVEMLMGLAA